MAGLKLKVFLAIIFCTSVSILHSADTIKTRLGDEINRYQPALAPVVTLDDNTMYLDLWEHPKNSGGYVDRDEIWVSHKDFYGVWSEPQRLGKPLNSKYPDVIFSISPDHQQALAFGSYSVDTSKIPAGFYFLKNINGKWIFDERLEIENYYNNSGYYSANLSADGRYLFMSLVREDGIGKHDLYISEKQSNGKWSEPENLGPVINSTGDEGAPFFAYDNKTLYFSSNGQKGYGKADIFMSRKIGNSWQEWSLPANLGEELNTTEDDKSIYLNALSDGGYMVSWDSVNLRSGLYECIIPYHLRPHPYSIVEGNILIKADGKYHKYERSADVKITGNQFSDLVKSDDKGHFRFVYPGKYRDFSIIIEDSIYGRAVVQNMPDTIINSARWLYIDCYFSEKSPIPGYRRIYSIYFDTDSKEITESDRKLLHEFFETRLSDINDFVIKGFADERGSEDYNYKLSEKRAMEVSVQLEQICSDCKIRIEAKGELQIKQNSLAENRRVDIFIPNK